MTDTISKTKLRARMYAVFRELEASGKELIVTDRDRPVLKIGPLKNKATVENLFGAVQGRDVYHEDINTPTLAEWDEA